MSIPIAAAYPSSRQIDGSVYELRDGSDFEYCEQCQLDGSLSSMLESDLHPGFAGMGLSENKLAVHQPPEHCLFFSLPGT